MAGTPEMTTLQSKMLQRENIIPLYYQIQELLTQQIESGAFKPGEMIPSENELCKLFEVSKATVLQAIQTLVNKRLVYRVKGKGTFVANPKINQNLTTLLSYSDEILGQNKTPKNNLLYRREAPISETLANLFGVEPGSPLYIIQRLREVDGVPTALQTSYLPKHICPGLIDQPLKDDSLYKTLQHRYNIEISSANETLQVVKADRYEAKKLEIKTGDPLFLIERSSIDTKGRPVELVKTLLRGDKTKFNIELKK
jgi:GntR family transcriptional regulator